MEINLVPGLYTLYHKLKLKISLSLRHLNLGHLILNLEHRVHTFEDMNANYTPLTMLTLHSKMPGCDISIYSMDTKITRTHKWLSKWAKETPMTVTAALTRITRTQSSVPCSTAWWILFRHYVWYLYNFIGYITAKPFTKSSATVL